MPALWDNDAPFTFETGYDQKTSWKNSEYKITDKSVTRTRYYLTDPKPDGKEITSTNRICYYDESTHQAVKKLKKSTKLASATFDGNSTITLTFADGTIRTAERTPKEGLRVADFMLKDDCSATTGFVHTGHVVENL